MLVRMDLRSCWAMVSLISCVIWLVMGSRANTIAHATSVMPKKRADSMEELRTALVKSIAAGVQIAFDQCRDDFKWERWNCPENDFARRYVLPSTREMAYVSSVTAAGIAYAVARACAKGQVLLPDCNCRPGLGQEEVEEGRKRRQTEGGRGRTEGELEVVAADWAWGNCASDLSAGQAISEVFLRSLENGARDIRAQANHHNFRLGRKSVELESKEDCKCHGMSGSCTTRTCWGRVAPFPKVGRSLKEKYQKALRVAANSHRSLAPGHDGEMVFLEDSPDFCRPNATTGWEGTEGRVCSRRRTNMADRSERRSCRELCRSCGHQVRRRPIKTVWRCNCTFHWCCNVTCSTCTKTEQESYCDATPSSLVRRAVHLTPVTY